MNIIKLDLTHKEIIIDFLKMRKVPEYYIDDFCHTFLTGLKTFHAYGALLDSGKLAAVMGYYESTDEASWFLKRIYGTNREALRSVLTKLLQVNESIGINKWYVKLRLRKTVNKFCQSIIDHRYCMVDEYMVGAMQKCKFNLAWQVLYDRTLDKNDTVIKCVFLKPECRTVTFNAGGLY